MMYSFRKDLEKHSLSGLTLRWYGDALYVIYLLDRRPVLGEVLGHEVDEEYLDEVKAYEATAWHIVRFRHNCFEQYANNVSNFRKALERGLIWGQK